MKNTNLKRTVALFLAMVTVLGLCLTSTAFAAADALSGNESSDAAVQTEPQNPGSVTDMTIDDVKEILNALSYDEYSKKYSDVPRADKEIVILAKDYDAQNTSAEVKVTTEYGGEEALYTPEEGIVSFVADIPAKAKYSIRIEYFPVEAKSVSIERIFRINGKVPFAEARYLTMSKVWTNNYVDEDENGRRFNLDIDRNELRPAMSQTPEWRTYEFKDVDGFYSETFEFVLDAGKNIISLEAVAEPMAIKSVSLIPHKDNAPYSEILEGYKANGYKSAGKDSSIMIQAEEPVAVSSQTVYPVEDNSSVLTEPHDSARTMLNTLGGEKWQTSGQWVRYTFTPKESGLYNIITRYKQNINDGLFSSRNIYIYGGQYNGIPFAEATALRFDFSDDWVVEPIGDGNTQFEFYFEAGVEYTIEIEVALGTMGDVIRRVESALANINSDYLEIIKLTGTSPDSYRDYGFTRVMPDTVKDLVRMSKEMYAVSEYLTETVGIKGSNIATLEKTGWLLEKMGTNSDAIAKNLDELKAYIGNLGTWVNTAKTQPLQLDYILIQGVDEEVPEDKAGFFASFMYEIEKFFMSFVRNYDRMGAQEEITEESHAIEVWLAYGRDQSNVIRTLINNEFTPQTGITVNLKLVAAGTLLPSILAGMGPDVYIGLSQAEVINYAIRSALLPIEDYEGYEETILAFNDAAMVPLGIEDAEGDYHCYGLPETQQFPMMFYRKDILADLDMEIPKTWDDILSAVSVFQANNMEIGLANNYKIFLYQMGGELFADNGMRINLDSNVALESFEKMCNMFTMYSFPYSYNFTNRFRTGEIPIGIADYSATYNNLVVFATEIKGLWEFVPLPGIEDENGNINNVSISTITANVMVDGCDDEEAAWEFMKWYSGESCQIQYSNEMVAILGDSAKHPTANKDALASLPWTTSELKNLQLQFNNLASIPNYPGYYFIDRYTGFAFMAAYNEKANPVTELLSYINTINKEITRKREEFGLETLEVGQTLAQKRLGQAEEALNGIESDSDAVKAAVAAIKTETDIDAIRSAAEALEAEDAKLFKDVVRYLNEAADALATY